MTSATHTHTHTQGFALSLSLAGLTRAGLASTAPCRGRRDGQQLNANRYRFPDTVPRTAYRGRNNSAVPGRGHGTRHHGDRVPGDRGRVDPSPCQLAGLPAVLAGQTNGPVLARPRPAHRPDCLLAGRRPVWMGWPVSGSRPQRSHHRRADRQRQRADAIDGFPSGRIGAGLGETRGDGSRPRCDQPLRARNGDGYYERRASGRDFPHSYRVRFQLLEVSGAGR